MPQALPANPDLDWLKKALGPDAATAAAFSAHDAGDWAQAVRRAAEGIGWGTPLPEGSGRGIAVGIKSGPTTGLSYSIVRLLADGSVVVSTRDLPSAA